MLVALAASVSTISPLAGQEGQWHYDDVTNLLDLMMAAVNDEHTSADCKRILTFSAEGLTKARDTRGVHWKWLNPNYAGVTNPNLGEDEAQIVVSTYLQTPGSTLTITYPEDNVTIEPDWFHAAIHEGLRLGAQHERRRGAMSLFGEASTSSKAREVSPR